MPRSGSKIRVYFIFIRTFIYKSVIISNNNYINDRSQGYITATIPGLKNKSLLKPMTWKDDVDVTFPLIIVYHILTV